MFLQRKGNPQLNIYQKIRWTGRLIRGAIIQSSTGPNEKFNTGSRGILCDVSVIQRFTNIQQRPSVHQSLAAL